MRYRDLNTLYVAPWGKGNGTTASRTPDDPAGPLDSLDTALNLAEQMRGGGMLQPIHIRLLAGNYCLSHPIGLRPTMSNITVEPFGDGEVLLSGGRRITGFEKTVFNGVPCFGAHVQDIEDGKWKFTDLYVDGLRAEITHLPKEGYFHMKDTENKSGALFDPSSFFTAELEDAKLFASLHAFEDCIVSFNHYWIDEHTPITSLDTETGRVNMTYRSRFTIRPGQEYVIENAAEAFGGANEWYCDRAAGMVYYIPRDEKQTPESVEIWAPVTEKLIAVEGQPDNPVTGVHFRDLSLAYTRGDYGSKTGTLGDAQNEIFASDSQAVSNMDGVVSLRYARNCTFEDSRLFCIGHHGIHIGNGCRSVKIERCSVYDGGAGGVRICGGAWGAPEHTMTTGCAVTDCTITHVGRRYLSACGILVMHAAETDLIHNTIGDLYYTGISCGWTWGYAKTVCRDNRIMNNHIYDLGKGRLSDMGGVYLLGSQPGTVVSGNKIHDIRCKEYGGWALYTDEGSAGILLEGNLCYHTSSNAYHQHYGSSNVVRNNIFADAGDALLRVSRPEAHLDIIFENNVLYSTGTPMLADFAQGFPGAHSLDDGGIVSGGNVFFCKGDVVYSSAAGLGTLADAQAHGMEEGSVIADPCFRDAENGDYTLRDDSPVFEMGFRRFDWDQAGARG